MEQPRPYLEQILDALSKRLDGEIAERSQRQLEITGRLAAVERDMQACIETLRQPTDIPERMKQLERRVVDYIDRQKTMAALDAADRQSDDDQICGC